MNVSDLRRVTPRQVRWLVSSGFSLMRVGARPVASVRNIANPDLRRSFPAYARRLRLWLTAAVVLWLVALAVGWAITWAVPIAVLVVFAGWALALRVRSRSSWLVRRGVPPGSVGVGPEPKLDPDLMMREAHRHGALFKSNQFAAPVVCIADLGLATKLFREHADDLGPIPMGFERHIPGGAIRWAERDRHDYLSGLFARAMAPTAVQSWRPQMAGVVDSHLDRIAATSNAADGFAPLGPVRELVRAAWSEMLFGIPSAGPDYAEVCSITDELDVYRPDPTSDKEIDRRLDRLSEMIRNRFEGDDTSTRSGVPAEIARQRPGALEDPGTIRNLIYAMLTARDDVGGLSMWILKHLADHPEWAEAVRTSTSDGVVDRVVSETLRLQQSEFLFRRAQRRLPVGDAVIPKGWIARVCIHEIHRDPDKFDDPERFDPDRFIDGGCGRDVYAPFGIDHHSCVGESFVRGFAAVFAERVTRRFDLEVVEDGPIELSAHRHWAPSGRFRLRLNERAESEDAPTS